LVAISVTNAKRAQPWQEHGYAPRLPTFLLCYALSNKAQVFYLLIQQDLLTLLLALL